MDKQFGIYSVDTKAFYTEEERNLNIEKFKIKNNITQIEEWNKFIHMFDDEDRSNISLGDFIDKKNRLDELKSMDDKSMDEEIELKELKEFLKTPKFKPKKVDYYETQQEYDLRKEREFNLLNKQIKEYLKDKPEYIALRKELNEVNNKLKENIDNFNGIREMNPTSLNITNRISLFDNSLSRAMGIKEDEVSLNMIIVRVYHYSVLKQLITNGFTLQRKKTINNITLIIDKEPIKYKVFTSSAGQIRTKKVVFMKEDLWNKYEKTLMCGLTIKDINESNQHGCNINKFLAYLALCNSATEELKGFNIDKAIVIRDFESLVKGKVDYIDNKTFEVTERVMDVPIPHSDGCGWVRKDVSKKNFMIRLPWVKGLVTPVNYIKFCDIYRSNLPDNERYLITDIYGKTHDLKKEDIEYVFSESQFKMYKYYTNDLDDNGYIIKTGWEKYVEYFKKYNCAANFCNLEPDTNEFRQACFNYQMWQTLIDITDEEIKEFTDPVDEFITKGYSDKNTMLEMMGATEDNDNKTWLQKCIQLYPELMQDFHCREELASNLNSKKKEAKYGKFKIDATYTFLLPDVFAWMQNIFLNIESPEGLLQDNEVCCRLYKNSDELLVNRSPHLYREHAVMKHIKYDSDYKGIKYKDWFITDGVYTSSHCHISKILQFDNDGDKGLVISDEKLIEIAKRNMVGIKPLYYEMGKAKPDIINENNIYESLTKAFKFNNIGKFSNQLTVMWNNYKDEKDLTTIAQITALNNFTIDAAKTLLVPEVPDEVMENMKKANEKLPYFFQFAKDKDEFSVAPINNSTVNRICRNIENIKQQNYNFSCFEKFNKNKLMNNSRISINEGVIEKYKEVKQNKKNIISQVKMKGIDKSQVLKEVDKEMKRQFEEYLCDNNIDLYDAIDMIVRYVYSSNKNSKKDFIFNLYGNVIYRNLIKNVGGTINCECCGRRFKPTNNKAKYCDKCAKEVKNKQNSKYREENRKCL